MAIIAVETSKIQARIIDSVPVLVPPPDIRYIRGIDVWLSRIMPAKSQDAASESTIEAAVTNSQGLISTNSPFSQTNVSGTPPNRTVPPPAK